MTKISQIITWTAARGSDPQNFLGARWILAILKLLPASKRRQFALNFLSLSPHYFLDADDPKYSGYSRSAYLESAFERCRISREKIFDQILANEMSADDTVLDYGCGPGFLSHVLAKKTGRVFAADISGGVLECARILNDAPNLEYLMADDAGLADVPDGGIDSIVSFAMVQHISDDILNTVLEKWQQKLRDGGKLIAHVTLLNDVWKTELDWKSDASLKGKLKYQYGLHCFGRHEKSLIEFVENRGFEDVKITPISDIVSEDFDDICSQHLLTAKKRS